MFHSTRKMLVRFVTIAAAVATTFSHAHACCCVQGAGTTDNPEHTQAESCPCQTEWNRPNSETVDSSNTSTCCHLEGDAAGCCDDGVCGCEACGCECTPKPKEAVVSESVVSPNGLSVSLANLVPWGTLHRQQESRADWQMARGSPLSATPQSLFCVWIN